MYRRVSEKLNQVIQAGGGSSGHSSLEDARATLDLVRWFITNQKSNGSEETDMPIQSAHTGSGQSSASQSVITAKVSTDPH